MVSDVVLYMNWVQKQREENAFFWTGGDFQVGKACLKTGGDQFAAGKVISLRGCLRW